MTNQLFHQDILDTFHIEIKNNIHIVDLMSVVRGRNLTWSGCMLFWSSMMYVIKHCSYSPKQFPSAHSLDIKLCSELVPLIHGSRSLSSIFVKFIMLMILLFSLWSLTLCETLPPTFHFFPSSSLVTLGKSFFM